MCNVSFKVLQYGFIDDFYLSGVETRYMCLLTQCHPVDKKKQSRKSLKDTVGWSGRDSPCAHLKILPSGHGSATWC